MLRKLNGYYPLQLELVPLALLIFILYLFLSNYGALPERIPSHFDLSGAVDRYGSKTEIVIYPVAATLAFLLFSGINLAFASVKDPRRLINLPESTKAAITPEAGETLRVVMLHSLLALKIVIMGMMAYMLYANLQVALGKSEGLGSWFPTFIVVLLAIVAYMLFRVLRLASSKGSPKSQ
jgi:uncharacterized membrane protein